MTDPRITVFMIEFEKKFPSTSDFCGCLDVEKPCTWPSNHKRIGDFIVHALSQYGNERAQEGRDEAVDYIEEIIDESERKDEPWTELTPEVLSAARSPHKEHDD